MSQPKVSGFVYVFRMEGTNFFKVGFTTAVETRLKQIQTDCPKKLTISFSIPGTLDSERSILECLKPFRTDGGTEWFETTLETIGEVVSKEKGLNINSSRDASNKKITSHKLSYVSRCMIKATTLREVLRGEIYEITHHGMSTDTLMLREPETEEEAKILLNKLKIALSL